MTVESTLRRNDYVGNGATATYNYAFKIWAATDLLVKTVTGAGVTTVLYYPADYSVTGVGNPGGGTITLAAGNLADGLTLIIERMLPYTQLADLRNAGGFYPESIEEALDKNVMLMQQMADTTDVPSIRVDLAAAEADIAALGARLDTAESDIIAHDGRLDALEAAAVYNPRGAWLTATAYAVNDTVTESGTTYICLFAHTSGTFATDLAAAYWASLAAAAAPTYAFRAAMASGGTWQANGTIIWDDDSDDDLGLFDSDNRYDTATGKFTVPADGIYHFSAQTHGGNDNSALSLIRSRGGVVKILAQSRSVSYTYSNNKCTVDTTIKLLAGDEVYCTQLAGTYALLPYPPYSWFSGHKVN